MKIYDKIHPFIYLICIPTEIQRQYTQYLLDLFGRGHLSLKSHQNILKKISNITTYTEYKVYLNEGYHIEIYKSINELEVFAKRLEKLKILK